MTMTTFSSSKQGTLLFSRCLCPGRQNLKAVSFWAIAILFIQNAVFYNAQEVEVDTTASIPPVAPKMAAYSMQKAFNAIVPKLLAFPETVTKNFKSEIPGSRAPGCTSIFRAVNSDGKPFTEMVYGIPSMPSVTSLYTLFSFVAKSKPSSPYLWYRRAVSVGKGPYVSMTYAQASETVSKLGSALGSLPSITTSTFTIKNSPVDLRILGIMAQSRYEWRLFDFAASHQNVVSVPIYTSIENSSLIYILQQTQMRTIVVEGKDIGRLVKVSQENNLKLTLISLDKPSSEDTSLCVKAGVDLVYWQDLISNVSIVPAQPTALTDVATIIFTSGTTGVPKGAIHTNSTLLSMCGAVLHSGNRMRLKSDDLIFSYLPMAHIYQRGAELVMTMIGAQIGYFAGDLLTISEDLHDLKPTVFPGVPRVYSKMLGKIRDRIANSRPIPRKVASMLLNRKRGKYAATGAVSSRLDILFRKIRKPFGGRIRVLILGGAPLDVQDAIDIQLYLSATFVEGWGMTEVSMIFVQDASDSQKGTVGSPIPCVEYRLESIPDSQYSTNDDPPRGELVVRGTCVTPEYFCNSEENAKAYRGDWFLTGDIAELGSNGVVKIIDRKKNIFKLAQGEYVAPERLEIMFSDSDFIDHIVVLGNSKQSYPYCIVTPNPRKVEKWAAAAGKKGDVASLLNDASLKKAILEDIKAIAKENEVRGFEIPHAVGLIEAAPTPESGLLTPTMKLIRRAFSDRYATVIAAVEKELAANTA